MLVTQSNLVATLPISSVKSEPGKGALALVDRKATLVGLEVLVDSQDPKLVPGDVVFVRSSHSNESWQAQKFTSDKVLKDGQKVEFILVPSSQIVAVESCLK